MEFVLRAVMLYLSFFVFVGLTQRLALCWSFLAADEYLELRGLKNEAELTKSSATFKF